MIDRTPGPRRRFQWAWAIVVFGVLAMLLLWVISPGEEVTEVPETAILETEPVTAPQGTTIDIAADPIVVRVTELTALSDLLGSPRIGELVGRDVELQAVPVQSVPGDMAFWIGESPGRRIYVLFEQVPTPDTPMEGRVDVNPGDRVNISGVVRAANRDLPENVDANIPEGTTAYIFAEELSVAS